MIDKADVRVPHFVPFTPDFGHLYKELGRDPKGPFKAAQHYTRVADLREYGHPAILHVHNVHGKSGNHKLELVETGGMTYRRMGAEISPIFATPSGPSN